MQSKDPYNLHFTVAISEHWDWAFDNKSYGPLKFAICSGPSTPCKLRYAQFALRSG